METEYVFNFEAYDRSEDTEGYRNRSHAVNVRVVSTDEASALEKVKELITRNKYTLEDIAELSEKHSVSGGSF